MNSREVIKNTAHKRRNKKILLLFLLTGITSLVLMASTYAWFVGTGTVKVNQFSVNLTTDEALEISLDGYTWNENLTITENTIKAHSASGSAYNGNTNSWVGDRGLVPVSTSGDNTAGVLDIYSKTAMTATNGGYRLTSNKLNNASSEQDYYVTFDIFLKNKTGDVYNSTYNLADDENLYLTTDSTVTSSATGSSSYGVQNSARVAFVQVGRISLDDLVANTTPDIKCQTPLAGDSYTPLCNASGNVYSTVIWEPNDLAHDSKLITYYNQTCKTKIGTNGDISYSSSSCNSLSSYTKTNTVKRDITSSDNVDIYDGLNSYTTTVQSDQDATLKPLQSTNTFTDTMKNTNGDYTFMKIAPHSVTKIRVYIYLEGQDVDNYDLVTHDQNIIVSFGFTKERTSHGIIMDNETNNSISLNPATLYNKVKTSSQGDSSVLNYDLPSSYSQSQNPSSEDYESGGVYQLIEDEAVYFYRGYVESNHVIFGGMCWDIIRTTNTGGVKLLYDGVPSDGACNKTGSATSLSTSTITTSVSGVPEAATHYTYTYNGTKYTSPVFTALNTWYASNLNSYSSYIEDTPYCNDNREVTYDANKIGSIYNPDGTIWYAPSYRSNAYAIVSYPDLSCSSAYSYTVSTDNGNGELTYPIGLITADEALLAGYSSSYTANGGTKSPDKRLCPSCYSTEGESFWTMTPASYRVSEGGRYTMIMSSGEVSNAGGTTAVIRPVISLKPGVLVSSGDGSIGTPYIIQTN